MTAVAFDSLVSSTTRGGFVLGLRAAAGAMCAGCDDQLPAWRWANGTDWFHDAPGLISSVSASLAVLVIACEAEQIRQRCDHDGQLLGGELRRDCQECRGGWGAGVPVTAPADATCAECSAAVAARA